MPQNAAWKSPLRFQFYCELCLLVYSRTLSDQRVANCQNPTVLKTKVQHIFKSLNTQTALHNRELFILQIPLKSRSSLKRYFISSGVSK